MLILNFDLGHEGKCLNLLNEVLLLFGHREAFGLVSVCQFAYTSYEVNLLKNFKV